MSLYYIGTRPIRCSLPGKRNIIIIIIIHVLDEILFYSVLLLHL